MGKRRGRNCKKEFKEVISSDLPLVVKWHCFLHLIYSFGFVSIIISMVLSVPLIPVQVYYPQYGTFFSATSIITISLLIYLIHYLISYIKNTEGSFPLKMISFIIRFPLFIALFIGVSLNNAIGIIKGYAGIKSAFIRTPKFNNTTGLNGINANKYTSIKFSSINLAEVLLSVYFVLGIIVSLHFSNYWLIPIFSIGAAGFAFVSISTIMEQKLKLRKA
jgi:hypothetical protein